MRADSAARLSAWDLGGWLLLAWVAQGHAAQLISKLNGLAISGRTANTVLHVAMQVSHCLRTAKQSPLRMYAVIGLGSDELIKPQVRCQEMQTSSRRMVHGGRCVPLPLEGLTDVTYLPPSHLMTVGNVSVCTCVCVCVSL